MVRKQGRKSLSEQLRAIIEKGSMSRYRIARESGVDASQLHRFVNETGRLTTDALDAIGSVLGLRFEVDNEG